MQKPSVLALAAVALSLLICSLSYAQPHKHPERWYQERWCAQRGQTEIILPDSSRCDCVTTTHMVEFDFGKKWAESIGQALNYAAQGEGRRAGIVLILERPGDERYLDRIKAVRAAYGLPLDLWAVEEDGNELGEQ